jgi:hypothetical protein
MAKDNEPIPHMTLAGHEAQPRYPITDDLAAEAYRDANPPVSGVFP